MAGKSTATVTGVPVLFFTYPARSDRATDRPAAVWSAKSCRQWSAPKPASRWSMAAARRSPTPGAWPSTAPLMDDDLRQTLASREIVIGEEWADRRPHLGVVCVTEGDEGLKQRLRTGDATGDVKKNLVTRWQMHNFRCCPKLLSEGKAVHFLARVGVPHECH